MTTGRNYGDRKETTLLGSAKISSTQKVDQPQKKSTKGLYMIKCFGKFWQPPEDLRKNGERRVEYIYIPSKKDKTAL